MQVVNATVLDRWNTLTDEDLVEQVLNGQTGLFEILMRRHNERIYRTARAVVGDEAEAEDVMQQAYVNAYTHLRQFKGHAKFSTWLTRIAVNEGIARRRRRGMYESFEEDTSMPTPMTLTAYANPEKEAFVLELRGLLESAVDDLADGYREVFMLREVEGLSTAETAESLGLSEDVIKTRLSRARGMLRRGLADRAGIVTGEAFPFQRRRCDRVVAAVMARIA